MLLAEVVSDEGRLERKDEEGKDIPIPEKIRNKSHGPASKC